MHQPVISIVPQRHKRDCAICCLAMLAGVSYEEALLACGRVFDVGMTTRQIMRAGAKLGLVLTVKRAIDLENDTGLLAVRSGKWPQDHLVVLKDGLVFDPDATVWDADVFLSAYDAKALSLLTVVG